MLKHIYSAYPHLKKKKNQVEDMAQVAEYLPSMHQAVGLIIQNYISQK
jgi:hypothetical protein